MIAIVNYGVGNIKAFENVYRLLNIPVLIASSEKDLELATKIILPGVGSFDSAMKKLNLSGMRPMLESKVFKEKIPLLGICVGMQMFADDSEEGTVPGLGWINGKVKKLPLSSNLPLPHMGWNSVLNTKDSLLLKEMPDSRFYFLHSYYFQSSQDSNIVAVTNYGCNFPCAIASENIYGVQFHPEKSHGQGIQLLKNFSELS